MKEFMMDIASILGLRQDEVTPDLQLKACALWDSLAMVSIITAIDEHFNKVLSSDEINQCEVFGDLMELANA